MARKGKGGAGPKSKGKADSAPCRWISGVEAFKQFATHSGGTQSAKHIKPLHWYIACRLVLEGGFHPDDITPRPPFAVEERSIKSRKRFFLSFDPSLGRAGEQVILGGLKTKNVDVVVNKRTLGPVMAVSCKGVTKAFRNLTNRMEETIGVCTNLHITYPALVLGYFVLMRANRTVQDAKEAPTLSPEEDAAADEEPAPGENEVVVDEKIATNDIAILPSGGATESIARFHSALREMTLRRGMRDEISRYEAITLALVEPRGQQAGEVFPAFPPSDSPLRLEQFFATLYQRYEERFVYGAALLADRGITRRHEWDAASPVFSDAAGSPKLDFIPRIASSAG